MIAVYRRWNCPFHALGTCGIKTDYLAMSAAKRPRLPPLFESCPAIASVALRSAIFRQIAQHIILCSCRPGREVMRRPVNIDAATIASRSSKRPLAWLALGFRQMSEVSGRRPLHLIVTDGTLGSRVAVAEVPKCAARRLLLGLEQARCSRNAIAAMNIWCVAPSCERALLPRR